MKASRGRQSKVDGGHLRGQDGVILIALLWILTALSIIALSFSRESFVEIAAARNAQSLEGSYFVARAGIAAVTYQLLEKLYNPPVQRAQLSDTPDPIDLGYVTGTLGDGVYEVNVQDESGKINVNLVSDEQLRALMAAVGIGKEDGDIITDSILDWRDPDSEHRLNGAEDDYYQALDPPYEAKDGRIDTVEELLLVRGMTPDYFYGRPVRDENGSVTYKYGLSRYLSVYTPGGPLNINYASLQALLSVPGMPPEAARAIYERRKAKPFKNIQELNEVGITMSPKLTQYLTVGRTAAVYTLTASAHAANSKVRRVIRTVISLEPGLRAPYRTLYWNENVPDYEGLKR